MRKTVLAVVLAVSLAGCSVTEPVVVIGKNGQILRGTATADLSGGRFNVTDGKLTCAGSYDGYDTSTTISMPVHCNDGRKGMVIATRDAGGRSGSGRVRLDDGMDADFIFGPAAKSF